MWKSYVCAIGITVLFEALSCTNIVHNICQCLVLLEYVGGLGAEESFYIQIWKY